MATPVTPASPATYISAYKIYIRGVLLGRADIKLTVSQETYELSALLQASGLGMVFSDARALVETYGGLLADGYEPQGLRYSWTGDGVIKHATLAYKAGAPVSYTTNYKPNRAQDVVTPVRIDEVGPGTRDPFLSLLIRQNPEQGDAFCRKPVRLFDGRRLARLRPENMNNAPPAPLEDSIACRVRWEPVAGYPKKTFERADEMHPLDIEFTPIADTRFLAPRELTVMTRFGTVRISAVEAFRESHDSLVPQKLEPPAVEDDFFD